MSGGIAVNPMVNKYGEKIALPAHCTAKTKTSFLEVTEQQHSQDVWSLWPREGQRQRMNSTVWWVPNAKSWFSLHESEHRIKPTEPNKDLEVFQIGTHDEDPSRAVCIRDSLTARGLGVPKRMQLLQIPNDCSAESDALAYNACLSRSGLDDCAVAGKLNLDAFDKVDWNRRLKVRDHVTKSVCGFQRALKALKNGESKYVLLLNENAVLARDVRKQITSFIQTHPEDVKGKAWKAIQIDPYGREAPIDQGLGAAWSQEKPAEDDAKIADFKYLNDAEAKGRFWGMHATLLKREAIPSILAQMQMEDGTSIGAVDRIPRHTQGWLAANLGVAYDPHMALLADECMPSRAEHFKVARSEIPESWTVQKEADLQ